MKLKKMSIRLIFFVPIILFIVYLVIPEIMYNTLLTSAINSEIHTGKIISKSENNQTRKYFEENEKTSVTCVTDFQGSQKDTGYLVASLKGDHAAGIFVKFNSFGPYLTNYHVISAKLID